MLVAGLELPSLTLTYLQTRTDFVTQFHVALGLFFALSGRSIVQISNHRMLSSDPWNRICRGTNGFDELGRHKTGNFRINFSTITGSRMKWNERNASGSQSDIQKDASSRSTDMHEPVTTELDALTSTSLITASLTLSHTFLFLSSETSDIYGISR